MLYGSHSWYRTMAKEFEKKFPFIKVTEYRTDGRTLIKRAIEENKAGQYLADIIATTGEQMDMMRREGLFLEHWTPDARFYPDDVKPKSKNGFHYVGHYETYASLGFNTTAIHAGRGAEDHGRSAESQMERQNIHRQHHHGHPLDRQHDGKLRPRISGKNRRARYQSAKHGRRSPGRPGGLRRSAAVADHLRRQHHPGQTKRRAGGLAPAGTGGHHRRLFRPDWPKRRTPTRRCCSSIGCIRKKANR